MNCEILSTLYVRANGEIPCNDDAGERISLGYAKVTPGWSIEDVLGNEQYEGIRNALAEDRLPWRETCERCAFLRSKEPLVDNLIRKRMAKLQVEPSLRCALACPGCTRAAQIEHRPGPFLMSLEIYERVLRSCAENGFRVDLIEYCGQGEPLSHPRFSDFARLSRTIFPRAIQRLVTNGNHDYGRGLDGEHLDEICVSCDGLDQESYGQYRINGSVSRALRFMADAMSANQARRPYVIWKYILFEFNDSTQELLAAQHRAIELGVDELLFVVTHSAFRSKRFAMANAHEVPLIHPMARVIATPTLTRDSHERKLINGPLGVRIARGVAPMKAAVVRRPGLRRFIRHWPLLNRLKRAAERVA